jgi:hypothetical protein
MPLRSIIYLAADRATIVPMKIPSTKKKLFINVAPAMMSIFASNAINSRLYNMDAPSLVWVQKAIPWTQIFVMSPNNPGQDPLHNC